ncbi:hypothetical protein O5O45_31615 [Hahella aquimaris]|uniref:WYL domain-containing protein n=1 Tax=Hahella sp. HNIBRBA332 TaxID=3015983 RepID=UPI00273C21FE|nr:WYL domain-containing protein [Hahella sp. HNIBRBA332]WLQ14268.1 hypothetical protein O5O45_31615 [Hahella sp. HNIBRBA332]
MNNYDNPAKFILRRAIWWGRVTRKDIVNACKLSPPTANRVMEYALSRAEWKSVLVRKPKHIEIALRAPIPRDASALTMLKLLEIDPYNFALIGLRVPDELQIIEVILRNPVQVTSNTAHEIIRATIQKRPLDIRYVGLRIGESGRWRTIVPVAFEVFRGQWRIRAHDLEDLSFKVKTFVVARILEAAFSEREKPKSLLLETGHSATPRYLVKLDPRLTPDQCTALRQELGLNSGGEIQLSEDALFDFQRSYMDKANNQPDHIIWPPVVDLQKQS